MGIGCSDKVYGYKIITVDLYIAAINITSVVVYVLLFSFGDCRQSLDFIVIGWFDRARLNKSD